MLGGNRFLDFADQVIARHRGLGFAFEPAAMLHLETQEQMPSEYAVPRQNITNNLYHIQNIKEENYLFKQNLSFLTQVLENKMYQNLYPAVEKQIEQVIREELPEAEHKIIQTVSKEMYRLVQQGGLNEFETIREKVLSEQTLTEKTHLKEQEKLFRKIENIFNSSVYQHAVINHLEDTHETNIKELQMIEQNFQNQQIQFNVQTLKKIQNAKQLQTIQNQNIQNQNVWRNNQNIQTLAHAQINQGAPQIYQAEIVHPEVIEHMETDVLQKETAIHLKETETTVTVLERTIKAIEKQKELLTVVKNQSMGNLGNVLNQTNIIHSPQMQSVQTISSQQNQQVNVPELHRNFERELQYLTEVEKQTELYSEVEKKLQTEVQKQLEVQQKNTDLHTQMVFDAKTIQQNLTEKNNQMVSVRSDQIHLEYPTEEVTELQQDIIEMIHSEVQRVPEVPKSVTAKTISEQILSKFETSSVIPIEKFSFTEKTRTINQLSHAILEYAEEKSTPEQLQNQMVQILEQYQAEGTQLPVKEIKEVLETTKPQVFNVETLRKLKNTTVLFATGENFIHEIQNHENVHVREGIRPVISEPKFLQQMDTAPMMYRSEEAPVQEESTKTKQLEQQVNEVVKTIKNVEEKTIIQKQQIIEQQKQVVHEVLKNNPGVWADGEGAGYIRKEVQQSLEAQMNQNVNQIANKVYRQLESKLKSERGRRGLI